MSPKSQATWPGAKNSSNDPIIQPLVSSSSSEIEIEIEGVSVKILRTNVDERGFFREVARINEEFGAEGFANLRHSELGRGKVRAWQVHSEQVSWHYVATGQVKLVLYDTRPYSATKGLLTEYQLGDDATLVVKVPPGVAYGYQALETSQLIQITSGPYDSNEQKQLPSNQPSFGYDWQQLDK